MDCDEDIAARDPYAAMSWREFESHVIEVLRQAYADSGLRIERTPYQNDGGRDGQASLVIGPPDSETGDSLALVARLWAEVKKRSAGAVDLDDIGGHVILAVHARVNKLLFITNARFSQRSRDLCQHIGDRLNLGVSFLDGVALRRLEGRGPSAPGQRPPAPGPQSDRDTDPLSEDGIRIETGYVATPLSHQDLGAADLHVDCGDIAYWVCTVRGRPPAGRLRLSLEIVPPAGLQVALLTPTTIDLEDCANTQRIVAAVWSDGAGCFDNVLLKPSKIGDALGAGLCMHAHAGRLHVRASVLDAALAGDRAGIVAEARDILRRLTEDGGAAALVLEAPAGAGKSFLLNRLRRECLQAGAQEISIDGGREPTVDHVVRALLDQALPIPPRFLAGVTDAAIAVWLGRADPAGTAAASPSLLRSLLANAATAGLDRGATDLVVSVLINASVERPVVIVAEDLHKASSAVASFLNAVLLGLASRRRGQVLVLATERPGTQSDRSGTGLGALLSGQPQASLHRLRPLSRAEALTLLYRSLQGLGQPEAETILDRVGTNPFHLREALQYLRAAGTIDRTPTGRYFLLRPEGVRQAADAGTLRQATRERLLWLKARLGSAFAALLLAGACLGREFSIARVVGNSGGAAPPLPAHLEDGIWLCLDHDILKPVADRGEGRHGFRVAFDHDLLRLEILRQAGAATIAATAARLAASSPPGEGADLERLRLAYLAGDAADCLSAASRGFERARQRRAHGDAFDLAVVRVALGLAGSPLRDATALSFVPWLSRLDEALTLVPLPRAPQPPDPERVLTALDDLLAEAEKVGVLESEPVQRLISIGRARAAYAGDRGAAARLLYYEGRALFGMNRYAEALAAFREAEAISPDGPDGRTAELSRLRVRAAVCERHLGRQASARDALGRALRLRPGPDWRLLQSVLANLGAFDMYTDQARAARHWSQALRVARLAGDVEHEAHFLNDLAHLDLMRRRYEECLSRLSRADALTHAHGLRKERLRSEILRACAHLAAGAAGAARVALDEADMLALGNGDLRRLWRVRANLATLAELDGDLDGACVRDLQALAHMPLSTELNATGTVGGRGTRTTAAVLNIHFRARGRPAYRAAMVSRLGRAQWRLITGLAEELAAAGGSADAFAGGIGVLLQPVGGGLRRFLVTE